METIWITYAKTEVGMTIKTPDDGCIWRNRRTAENDPREWRVAVRIEREPRGIFLTFADGSQFSAAPNAKVLVAA